MLTARDIFSYRKYWAKRFGPAPFLPMSRAEMDKLGWDFCDTELATDNNVSRKTRIIHFLSHIIFLSVIAVPIASYSDSVSVNDDAVLSTLQSMHASALDAALPDISLNEWINKIIDDKYEVFWKVGECGRFRETELRNLGPFRRVCLVATDPSAFGREIEIIFDRDQMRSQKLLRRIRFYHQLRPVEWVELSKLSQIPYVMEADKASWKNSGEAWRRTVEEIEEDKKLGTSIIRCTVNPSGMSSLMKAADKGDLDKVVQLLRNGVDVNEKSIGCGGNWHESPLRNKTALMFAAEKGHIQIVQALLEAGASVKAYTNKATDAWYYATENNHLDVLKILWKERESDIPERSISYSLYRVATRRQPEMVRFLAEKIKNPALLLYPLEGAARMGDAETVRILLANGAWVTGAAIAGAAYHGSGNGREALELLLKNCDTPDLRWMQYGVGLDYVTPLMIAVRSASTDWGIEGVRILIRRGADVNAVDANGRSVTEYAGGAERMKYLLKDARINLQ